MEKVNTAILLMHCPDQNGILHNVTDFILSNNGKIVSTNQHVDTDIQHFFMRIEWRLENFGIPKDSINEFFHTLVAKKFDIDYELHFSNQKPRMALFVSRYAHCFFDILSRYESGEMKVEIPLIISNHEKFRAVAQRYDIPYHCIEITKENKLEQEKIELELLKEHRVDFIVLARYMQVLSDKIVDQYPKKIINIHHSSLPAFAGADPYGNAFKRGVKFMGATGHYVTEELDAGPIISQDVISISHRDSKADMKRKGKDVEKIVLARAVWSHLNYNILTYKNKTVVFD